MFRFPFTNLHELNLDWILSVVKQAMDIFEKGKSDIQYAIDTANNALETAEQAAGGVIADGSVTLNKLNDSLLSLGAFVVAGSVTTSAIPKDSIIIVKKSTIPNIQDGIYIASSNITESTILTENDLEQPANINKGALNYILDIINNLESGLVSVVDGNNASAPINPDGIAYIKNNNTLSDGFYINISGEVFPVSGAVADSTKFNRIYDVLNTIVNNSISKELSNKFYYGLFDKTINILGDSISNNTDDWPGFIPADNNITINNLSESGIKISGENGLTTKLTQLNTNAEINILFAGTNDYAAQAEIGNITDSNITSFYGALNTILSYIANTIPNSKTFIVTPLKRSLVSNASIPLEVYCNAFYKIADKYGAVIIDAYHNAPDWNPLVTSLEHWCNIDKVHPLPAYNEKFLMPYIMGCLTNGTSDKGLNSKSNFYVSLDSTFYTSPQTTTFEVDSDGYINIVLTGSFTNSGTTAARVSIGNIPQWANTGRQEWGIAGMITVGTVTGLPFYVNANGQIVMDLLPGSNWCFASVRYKI